MRVCTFASGSSGNCIYVGTGKTNILIDAGISCKRINQALEDEIGISSKDIDGIFITHEHTDHIQGLEVFTKKFKTPIYTTKGTWQGIMNKTKAIDPSLYNPIENNQLVEIGNLLLDVFSTSHDALDPVGFLVNNGQKSLGIATDLGMLTPLIIQKLKNADGLILEANYDQAMLMNGSYPSFLKRRIASLQGHLSNEEAGKGLLDLLGERTRTVILAHLSQENNMPILARKTIEKILQDSAGHTSFNLEIASRTRPGASISI